MRVKEHLKQSEKNGRMPLNRRHFLLLAAGAGAGLAGAASAQNQISRFLLASQTEEKKSTVSPDMSRVVVVKNEKIFGGGKGPVASQIDRTLAVGMGILYDQQDATSLWQRLFKPDDVVGIKVNCIAGPQLSTHPALVDAIVAQLKLAGVPPENIIIWDRTNRELTRAGYTINTGPKGVKCYGTDAAGYEEKAVARGKFNGKLSTILTRQITALINAPILKNHGGAGVTISMKNHYGSFHNPGDHHKNLCDPYIADLNSLDEIRSKTRLIICDATRATCNGGPGHKPAFTWNYSGLLLSTDTVALDTVGASIIDERREEVGLPSLEKAGRPPRQLASAAERGLGNTSMNKIDLRRAAV
jgi:uncharacterized protein (DUF362 family)